MLGIGLNVSSAPGELPATHLREHDPEATAAGALDHLLAALERRLAAPSGEILEAWRARDALIGERVRWEGGEGTAAGIDDTGALLVETGEGRVALDAGEVHLLR